MAQARQPRLHKAHISHEPLAGHLRTEVNQVAHRRRAVLSEAKVATTLGRVHKVVAGHERRRAYESNDTHYFVERDDMRPAKRARLDTGDASRRDDDDEDAFELKRREVSQGVAVLKKRKTRRTDASSPAAAAGPIYYEIVPERHIDSSSPLHQVKARSMTPGYHLTKRQALPTPTAGLSPAQITSLLNSITTSRGIAASSAAASLDILSRFEQAASQISSRRGESYTGPFVPPPSATPTNADPSSSSSSQSSLTASSGANDPSNTSAPQSNDNDSGIPLRNIVIPAVVIPTALIILALLIWWLYRRSERRHPHGAATSGGRATPASLGGIRGPYAQQSISGSGGGGAGGATAAGLTVPAAAYAAGRAHGNNSAESFATSPSAIGVAYSEPQPRTRWGRRSLTDVMIAGAASEAAMSDPAMSEAGAGAGAGAGGRHGVLSQSSSFGGRQPSITGLSEIGSADGTAAGGAAAGGYAIYRPGMPRPLMSPVGTKHYDPFAQPPRPDIVAVPERRRSSELASAPASSGDDGDLSSGSSLGSDHDERDDAGDNMSESAYGGTELDLPHGANTEQERDSVVPGPPPMLGNRVPFVSARTRTQTNTTFATASASADDVFYTDAASSHASHAGASGDDDYEALYTPMDIGDGDVDAGDMTLTAPVDFGSSSGSGSGSASGHGSGGSREGVASSILSGSAAARGTPTPRRVQASPASTAMARGGSLGGSIGGSAGGMGGGGNGSSGSSGSIGSHSGTPRLGAGHGSMSGIRGKDGSWW